MHKSPKKNIAMDLDDVLADLRGRIVEEVNHILGKTFHIDIEDVTNAETWGPKLLELGYTPKTLVRKGDHIWRYDWESIPFLDTSAIDAIEKLQKMGFDVDIVTRNKNRTNMNKWINFYGIPHDNLIIKKDKASLNYTVYVDDMPIPGVPHIFYDRPWNRSLGSPRIYTHSRLVPAVEKLEKKIIADMLKV